MDPIRRPRLGYCLLLLLSACSLSPKQAKLCETSRSLPSMGSFIQVGVLHQCEQPPNDDIFVRSQKRLDEIEKQFSLYIQDSDLMRWNRGDRSFNPGPDFNILFGISRNLKVKTESYFDITALKSRGTPVSFDGIAKGYAVDELAKLIQSKGYEYYKINFSGNLKWNTPKDSGAAASSGNKHRPGHILNPKTQKAVLEKDEALVQGPSATVCDALSTAYFAAPEKERAAIEKNFPNYFFSMGD